MKDFITPAKGKERLFNIAALPCRDLESEIRYYGSIAKCGDNSDWDWGMFQDENGEWVLAEADGAGCIYNFTQHRYPTSEVPTFKFYFDNSKTPQFEITPAEFGKKAPFLKPLADIFEGPEDNGRGPIWVVRSFVPMEFTTHCKVTSNIKLEGADKSLGEGGWGHVTMQLYRSSSGLKTFSANNSIDELLNHYKNPLKIVAEEIKSHSLKLLPNTREELASFSGSGAIVEIAATVKNFKPEILEKLFVSIEFDSKETVYAPFGTFFGNEYGKTPAKLETALLGCDILGKTAYFSNFYPMPYFRNAVVKLENKGSEDIEIPNISVGINGKLCYNPKTTGYFTSSEYYQKTPNVEGKNSVIADVSGSGQMVYGVISGEDIQCGCEGDVRVFLDNLSSPSVESDGSESWGSYGWGFVCPPQCNPFSAYNGVPDINDTWSELRLTFTDSYPFKSRLLFELEHGCKNDGGGYHSGQIFCYLMPEAEKEVLEITPESDNYITDGKPSKITDRFENGIHKNYHTFTQNKGMTYTKFECTIPAENRGLVLKRVSTQENARMEATVLIDGAEITERNWLYPDFNNIYCLLEDIFNVPSSYTAGKSKVTVEIRPKTANWNECRYRVSALTVDK